MKLLNALTLAVVSATFVDAKYFWQSAQPTPAVGPYKLSELPKLNTPKARPARPGRAQVPRSPKGVVRSITDSLTTATGYNVTGLYERAQSGETFDRNSDASDGFIRLTDDNFDEQVVYERLDLAHDKATEDERVWFFYVHGPPKDPASFVFWDAINNASIINRHPANHIRGLKWGRIDFLTELELTTRWMIFKPPMLVFATKRATELRFVNSRQMAANGTIIHRFLKEEMWRNLPVWQSRYAPGGDRAWMPTVYIKVNKLWSRLTDRIPSWLLVILSGMITQSLLGFMHRGNGNTNVKSTGTKQIPVAVIEPAVDAPAFSVSEKTDDVKVKAAAPKVRKETKKGK